MNDALEPNSDIEWERHDSREGGIEDDNESRYPPFRTVIVSMVCIYAAMFLSALVSKFSRY